MDEAKNRLHLRNPWHLLATGFGSGLAPYIPGTVGSLAAIPFGLLFAYYLPTEIFSLVIVFSICIGIYICGRTAKDMAIHDHGSIVWDEFVGMWISMLVLPILNWQWVLVAFLLFRFFDMLKPWPISWFDRNVHGGMGIMIDDIVAGVVVAVIIFCAGHFWMPRFMF